MARGEEVSFIDVKIKSDRMVDQWMWMTSCTGSARAEDLEKVSWVESCLGRRRLTFASSPKPGQKPWAGVTRDWGRGRWKSQNRKNVYLSPYVEEPLNSKVIKSFVPEQRSKFFSCFQIPMFHVYMLRTLWTFCVPVWICPFHVFISRLWYTFIYCFIYTNVV